MAEFVMVAALLLFVALAIFQLGLALYVRNTLVSAASEGARLAARADAAPADGVSRTKALITSSIGEEYARQVSAGRVLEQSGVRAVEITVRAPLPVVGPLGPSGALAVTGRAFAEDQIAGAAP
ncbi:TadE/TadG family type IV pilus assembly protein [Monashia sp. NPDC004114]